MPVVMFYIYILSVLFVSSDPITEATCSEGK